MKYVTIFVMSMFVLLFAACAAGGEDPTAVPDPIETKPAATTAVPTGEAYPVEESTPVPVESYPAAAATVAALDPYPDQAAQPAADAAYPADGNAPDEAAAIIQQVSLDLAARLEAEAAELSAASVEAIEWSDSSLGCPAPGYGYAQVITPGYQITLEFEGQSYNYHTDLNGNFVLCGADGQPVE